MEKFFNWLIDTYLYNVIVLRKDYDNLHLKIFECESWSLQLLDELKEAYVKLYTRTFKPFEDYGESIKAEFIEFDRVDIPEFEFGYHFRISHRQYKTLNDLTQMHRRQKEVVISKLVAAFEKHMQKNLFRDL